MSYIVYDENLPRSGGRFDFENADATKFYLEHYSNRLLLSFIANNPSSTFSEKAQACKELILADKKCAYWRRHPKFNIERAPLWKAIPAAKEVKRYAVHLREDGRPDVKVFEERNNGTK